MVWIRKLFKSLQPGEVYLKRIAVFVHTAINEARTRTKKCGLFSVPTFALGRKKKTMSAKGKLH
jgi:hypothetical protein